MRFYYDKGICESAFTYDKDICGWAFPMIKVFAKGLSFMNVLSHIM